jgi:hypothetical protein
MRALREDDVEKGGEPGDGEFRVPGRAERSDQEKAIRRVAEAVHQLNERVMRAVKAGVSIELVRGSRWHDGAGNWGDQMVPLIRQRTAPAPTQQTERGTADNSEGEEP